MKIKKLHLMPGTRTWTWRTVEGDKGNYYTFDNGCGILFHTDDHMNGGRIASVQKFKVCKTASGTRQKLNRIFAPYSDDPVPGNEWRL